MRCWLAVFALAATASAHDAPEVPRHLLLPSRVPAASVPLDEVRAEFAGLSRAAREAIAHYVSSCTKDAADRDALIRALLSTNTVKADAYAGHHGHH